MIKPLFTAASFLTLSLLPQVALALDCTKAKTAAEKAICADPKVNAADDAMTKAYTALAAASSEAQKMSLLLSQRGWLTQRANRCVDATHPATATASACLLTETQKRLTFLQGLPSAGPGSGSRLEPTVIATPKGKGRYQLDVTVLKFANPKLPGEKRFNTEVDKLLRDVPEAKSEGDMEYSYVLDLVVAYASPRFLSARYETYDFSGGAHGNGGIQNLNIDMQDGRTLGFADLFDAASEGKLTAGCTQQIKAQKGDKEPDADFDLKAKAQEIAPLLRELDRWSFGPAGATVTFNPYELGSYAEGEYECSFDAATLRPLVKRADMVP